MHDPGRRHLLCTAPLCLSAALAACASPTAVPAADGRFVEWPALPSAFVQPRHVRVWLPPGYDSAPEPHAVLYMHDGQNLFDPPSPMAHGAWEVDRHLVALRRAQAIRPTIVVAIWNTEGHRAREYGPQAPIETLPADLQRLVPAPQPDGQSAPLSDAYLRFIVDELKPQVDRSFRTRSGPADTFVMGSSMGGLISLYALCRHPQVFGAAACLSTHWIITTHYAEFVRSFAADTPPDARVEAMASAYRDWLRHHLPAAGAHRLYFDHGTAYLDGLYPRHQRAVDQIVAAKGYRRDVDWVTREFPGAPHNESAWRARLDVPLKFLLR